MSRYNWQGVIGRVIVRAVSRRQKDIRPKRRQASFDGDTDKKAMKKVPFSTILSTYSKFYLAGSYHFLTPATLS
jgi:hypothetical protein